MEGSVPKSEEVVLSVSRKLLVTGLAIGALLLGGCGPVAEKEQAAKADPLTLLRSDAKASLQNAAQKSTEAKSVTVKMTGSAAGTSLDATGHLAFGDETKADMVMTMMGMQFSIRIIGTVEYVQLPPALLGKAAGGKKWMKIDLAQVAELGGLDAEQFKDQMDSMDPSKQIKAMLDKGTMTVAGEESIDGVKTVHYVSDLTLDEYIDAYVAPRKQQQMREGLQKAGGMDSIKTELWVDESYQVRKSRISGGSVLDMTSLYTDYGKPVVVEAPPAAETQDMVDLVKNRAKVPA